MRNVKRFSLISSVMAMLLSVFVSATLLTTIQDGWTNVLKISSLSFLTNTTGGALGDLEGLLRLVVGILVFTILYAGSVTIADFTNKNIRIALSAVLSILSVILMPGTILVAIAGSFSGFFGFIFLALPHAGIGWFFFKTKSETRGENAMKLGAALLGVFLAANIAKHTGSIGGLTGSSAGVTAPWGGTVVMLLGFFEYVVFAYIILALWFGYKTAFPDGKSTKGPDGKKARANAVKFLSKFDKDKAKTVKWELREWVDIQALQNKVNSAANVADLNKLKRNTKQVKKDEVKANKSIFRLESDAKKVPKGPLRKKLLKIIKNEIEVQNNIIIVEMKKLFTTLRSTSKTFTLKKTEASTSLNAMVAANISIHTSLKKLKKQAKK